MSWLRNFQLQVIKKRISILELWKNAADNVTSIVVTKLPGLPSDSFMLCWLWDKTPGGRKLYKNAFQFFNCCCEELWKKDVVTNLRDLPSSFNYVVLAVGPDPGR